jgi:DNA polymerase III delta prime subunit
MKKINILFIGNMGSGKTSLLNALIKEYYSDISPSLYNDNILYINSLKEQGIHYYRNDVKTFCQTCSSVPGKKKIVVLDDIDLMNEQSQQVFRNCIDKFNENVHFISSCSNIQKVNESLQSRLTIIQIQPLERSNMHTILKKIKHTENIDMNEETEQFLLDISNNTAKVLINYMEKCKLLNQTITLEIAMNVCTNISFMQFSTYTEMLKAGNLQEAIKILYSIYDNGYSVMDILDNYFLFVKVTKILSEDDKYKIIPFICKYITVFYNVHEEEIELALFTNNIINIL